MSAAAAPVAAGAMASLLRELPSDLLGEVLSFTSLDGLCAIVRSHACFGTEILTSGRQEHTFKLLCKRDWKAKEVKEAEQNEEKDNEEEEEAEEQQPHQQPQESWLQCYRRYTAHFGPAARSYNRVEPLWRRLLAWLESHAAQLPANILATIPSTFGPPGGASSAAFAAATAAAAGTAALPPSLSYAEAIERIAARQVEWSTIQQQARKQMRKDAEGEKHRDKRQSKRDRSAAANSAAAAANSSDVEMKSGDSSPAASSATMDFETAIGLPKLEQKSDSDAQTAAANEGFKLSQIQVDPDLMCALLMHNGQSPALIQAHVPEGMFGGFSFYNYACQYRLQDLDSMLDQCVETAQHEAEACVAKAKKERDSNKRRKSEPMDSGSSRAAAEAASAAAQAQGNPQAAASANADAISRIPLLLPFAFSPIGPPCDFLLDPRSGEVVRRCRDDSLHVVAPSFLAFFSRYVDDLERGMFVFSRDASGINRFPLLSDTGSDTTTRGIRVQVSVLYVPEQSVPIPAGGKPSNFFFTYSVRISHDSSTATIAELVSRHWIIEDANGKIEHVEGPGVIGLTPRISPGCEVFNYESCCPIATSSGKMRGSFRFKTDADESFDVLVGQFIFDIKRNYC